MATTTIAVTKTLIAYCSISRYPAPRFSDARRALAGDYRVARVVVGLAAPPYCLHSGRLRGSVGGMLPACSCKQTRGARR
jgi:hypothetical protein